MDAVSAFGEGSSVHFIGIQEGVSVCSIILIMMLLIWTYFAFDDQQQKYNKSIPPKIRAFCFLCMVSYLLMAGTMAILLNNFVVLSQTMCRVFYLIHFFSFNIGNISMYFMISFHIQSIFPLQFNGTITLSPYLILIYRIFCLLIPSALWILYLLLAYDHIDVTQIGAYEYCYASQYHNDMLSQIYLTLIAFCHTVCIIFLLFGIVSSSINYTNLISTNMNSAKRVFIQKLARFIRKAAMLCIISITCMVALLCLSAYLLQQITFFLVIDGIVNIYCIVCILDIGNVLYSKTCGKVERLCKCTYCIFDRYLDKNNILQKRQYYIAPSLDQISTIMPLRDDSKTKTVPLRPHQPSITPFSGMNRSSKSKSSPFTLSYSKNGVLVPLGDSEQSAKTTLLKRASSVASEIEMENTLTDGKGAIRIE